MAKNINKQVKNATKWSAITEITAKLITPITSMVLARLLTPEAYGIIATLSMIIVFADSNAPTYLYDGALAMGNLMNAANALGVDSCWIHRAKEVFETEFGKKLKREWKIPESYEGIGHCILGYRAQELPDRAQRTSKVIYA